MPQAGRQMRHQEILQDKSSVQSRLLCCKGRLGFTLQVGPDQAGTRSSKMGWRAKQAVLLRRALMTENALCSAAISSETGSINAWKGRRHAICCKTAPGIFWSCGLSQPFIGFLLLALWSGVCYGT